MKRSTVTPVLTLIPTLVLACGLVSACGSSDSGSPFIPGAPTPPPTPNVDRSFTLGPGETANVPEVALQVRFLGVLGDSRCPGDALCISQGEASLLFEVVTHGISLRHEMRTSPGNTVLSFPEGYRVELVQLMPYPFASLPPIGANDYRATVKVTSRP